MAGLLHTCHHGPHNWLWQPREQNPALFENVAEYEIVLQGPKSIAQESASPLAIEGQRGVSSLWDQRNYRNKNDHVVERSIGIDSRPQKCVLE